MAGRILYWRLEGIQKACRKTLFWQRYKPVSYALYCRSIFGTKLFRLIRGRDEFNSFEQIFKDYIKTLPGEEHNEQRARTPTRRSSTYDELFSLAIENDISITATPSSINTEISDYLNRAYLNPTISASGLVEN